MCSSLECVCMCECVCTHVCVCLCTCSCGFLHTCVLCVYDGQRSMPQVFFSCFLPYLFGDRFSLNLELTDWASGWPMNSLICPSLLPPGLGLQMHASTLAFLYGYYTPKLRFSSLLIGTLPMLQSPWAIGEVSDDWILLFHESMLVVCLGIRPLHLGYLVFFGVQVLKAFSCKAPCQLSLL